MADADEDTIPRGGGLAGDDVDLSDETQDFRFLSAISKEDATIPKRGEKDFEPHATELQSNILAASRQAMHNALSYERVHQPKGHTIGTYHPETNMCYAINPKGPLFMKLGRVLPAHQDPFGDNEQRGNRTWLYPEEALYLLERGTMDIRWPVEEVGEGELGLPMSLQAGYAMFLGDEDNHEGALTFERFTVYSGLKRSGYTVLRGPSWNSTGPTIGSECYPPAPVQTWRTGLGRALKNVFAQDPKKFEQEQFARQVEGPIIPNDLYRDYQTIYRRLALINFHDPTLPRPPQSPEAPSTDPNLRITYHVWKPGSAHFKKSNPVDPDFRIAVVDARKDKIPSLDQLGALLDTTPYNPPKNNDAHMHVKLKHGYKNVILAVVDNGVPSYLRIADAAFGHEKVYERTQRGGGGKRGGRGGGRGRGRGRGGR
ncbi:putative tRNA-splicing endonuclease, subunit Sen54 [Septoria linicola]|nr:putative tRNA-splicing endonuclease, subunit Sen54 [Septoria linicola]